MEYMDVCFFCESSVNFLQFIRVQFVSLIFLEFDVFFINFLEEEEVFFVLEFLVKCFEQIFEFFLEQFKVEWFWILLSRFFVFVGFLWIVFIKVVKIEVVFFSFFVCFMVRKELEFFQIYSIYFWCKFYINISWFIIGFWKFVWVLVVFLVELVKCVLQVVVFQFQKVFCLVIQCLFCCNKCVIFFFDIIENFEFLFNKRGIFGIFQFFWGEKFDMVFVQVCFFVLMVMFGIMVFGVFVCFQQIEFNEYFFLFFDDYDDDDDVVDGMNFDEDGSDDGFDEIIFWEIVSLFKVDNVFFRSSLVFFEDFVLGDYVEEFEFDDEDQFFCE